MENSNLKKFENQALNESNTTNVKGGSYNYGALMNAITNQVVFGGTGCNSWLYRLVNNK